MKLLFCLPLLLIQAVNSGDASVVHVNSTETHELPICGPFSEIHDYLEGKHNQITKHFGIMNDGNLLEVFISPHGEVWSIVITTPSGRSCLVLTGENWRNIAGKIT